MTLTIEQLSQLAGEDYRAKDEAEKRKREGLSDPFKTPRTEPGRARPGHGRTEEKP